MFGWLIAVCLYCWFLLLVLDYGACGGAWLLTLFVVAIVFRLEIAVVGFGLRFRWLFVCLLVNVLAVGGLWIGFCFVVCLLLGLLSVYLWGAIVVVLLVSWV